MAIVIKRALHQQDGEQVKSTTMPIELQKGTEAERASNEFESYSYGGYHKSTIADYLKGSNGSPYSRQYTCDGKLISCGINWFEQLQQRLDMMLRATGEPVVLYRRKWTGERCPNCDQDTRTGRGVFRCNLCFGTGYIGGYVRYISPREPDGRIYVRFGPTQEDLNLQEGGLTQGFNPTGWTLPSPILRDWDVLVRFDPRTHEETWRYEITNLTRNKGFYNIPTAQNFTAARTDKTDPIYSIKEVDLMDNLVGRLQGDHDNPDLLQQQIEKRYGQGHNDQGFSEGYIEGFRVGSEDGTTNKDYNEFPRLANGQQNTAYNNQQLVKPEKQYWLYGYRTGYKDGFEYGQEMLRRGGYQSWTTPRDVTNVRSVTDPPVPVQDYDDLERHSEIWRPYGPDFPVEPEVIPHG